MNKRDLVEVVKAVTEQVVESQKKSPVGRVFEIVTVTDAAHPVTGEPILSKEQIEAVLASKKTIKHSAYILHDKDVYTQRDEIINPEHKAGMLKSKHWHIVLELCGSTELRLVAGWFGVPENFVEIPYARTDSQTGKKAKLFDTFLDKVEYLDHCNQSKKYKYNAAEIVANFDFKKALDMRNSKKEKYGTDLIDKDKELRLKLLHGEVDLKQVQESEDVLYIENSVCYKRMWNDYLSNANPPTRRISILICTSTGVNQSGTGKTTIAKSLCRVLTKRYNLRSDGYHMAILANTALNEYNGELFFIFDDFKGGDFLDYWKEGTVKHVFDENPERVSITNKGGYGNLLSQFNIVTTQQTYLQFYDSISGEQKYYHNGKLTDIKYADSPDQYYRRIPIIIEIDALNKKLNVYMNKYFINKNQAIARCDYEDGVKKYYPNLEEIFSMPFNFKKYMAIMDKENCTKKNIDAFMDVIAGKIADEICPRIGELEETGGREYTTQEIEDIIARL